MKWFVNGEEFLDARAAADYIMENGYTEDDYDDMLDEVYGEIKFGDMSYAASSVLYNVDPVAYNCGYNDWKDARASDIAYELEQMCDGLVEDYYSIDVECVEEDEEEDEDEEEGDE